MIDAGFFAPGRHAEALEMNVLPIVNENDTVAVEEIAGDNVFPSMWPAVGQIFS